jgi:hypothetical protein
MAKVQDFGSDARVLIGFHGTLSTNHTPIMHSNFSMRRVGQGSHNNGWFGSGIYFARRAFTALGYNKGGKELLACLLVVQKTLPVPGPPGPGNKYHGQPCEEGYDSHLSPTGKELCLFNPRQILPCFLLELNSTNYLRVADEGTDAKFDPQDSDSTLGRSEDMYYHTGDPTPNPTEEPAVTNPTEEPVVTNPTEYDMEPSHYYTGDPAPNPTEQPTAANPTEEPAVTNPTEYDIDPTGPDPSAGPSYYYTGNPASNPTDPTANPSEELDVTNLMEEFGAKNPTAEE